jgi:PhnB protein
LRIASIIAKSSLLPRASIGFERQDRVAKDIIPPLCHRPVTRFGEPLPTDLTTGENIMARRAKTKSRSKSAKRKVPRRTAAKRAPARKKVARKAAKRPARKAAKRPAGKVAKRSARKAAAKRKTSAASARRMAAVTPHIILSDASGAIAFYKKAFGAEEMFRMPTPDGLRLLHASIRIGDSTIMMCDEFPEMGEGTGRSPTSLGGSSTTLHLNVANADAAFDRAVDAGCTVTMPLADMFWGDRYGKLRDPYGHEWSIGQHLRDVSPADMKKATDEMFSQQS